MQFSPAAARYIPILCCRFFALQVKKPATKDKEYRSAKG
jgi:hypothetical protein